jgi:formate-dependent nitrite reductase membrane component NrfD
VEVVERTEVRAWTPTFLLGFMILGLVGTSFLGNSINHHLSVNLSGIICAIFGFMGLIWYRLGGKKVENLMEKN